MIRSCQQTLLFLLGLIALSAAWHHGGIAFAPPSARRRRLPPIQTSIQRSLVPVHVVSDTLIQNAQGLVHHHDLLSGFSSLAGALADASSITDNPILAKILSQDQPFQYLFMFPTMTLVATCCQLAGIGGAALLSPIFLLVFPLLGSNYPLASASAAIASALLTEVFGFASGLSGYWRRGLVDWGVALPFLFLSVPAALGGALAASTVSSNVALLRGVYAALMIGLAAFLTFSEKPEQILKQECDVPQQDDAELVIRTKTTQDGTTYRYLSPGGTSLKSAGATISGSLLTGLLGVGIGEVVLPQLVRRNCMPIPVAAGTSVAVVVVTALVSALVQFLSLASQVTSKDVTLVESLVDIVPWSLVQYTIPGALIGGQIASFLASRRLVDDETIEALVAALFAIIGIAFSVKCITG